MFCILYTGYWILPICVLTGQIPLAALELYPVVFGSGDVRLGVDLTPVVLRVPVGTPVTHPPRHVSALEVDMQGRLGGSDRTTLPTVHPVGIAGDAEPDHIPRPEVGFVPLEYPRTGVPNTPSTRSRPRI